MTCEVLSMIVKEGTLIPERLLLITIHVGQAVNGKYYCEEL